jgi:hypothetical protein
VRESSCRPDVGELSQASFRRLDVGEHRRRAALASTGRGQRGRHRQVLLVDGARKLADGDQLMWKQTVLVRGE